MKADRDTFGPRLRLERERRGISLKHIAESTKIKESLFAELERGDVSRWPQGIFRRAHLCAYTSAIGLPSQTILAEFLELYPDEHAAEPSDASKAADPATGPVAVQAGHSAPSGKFVRQMDRAWISAFDLATVCLLASAVSAVSGMSLWSAVVWVGLAYFGVGGACLEGGVGGYARHRIRSAARARIAPAPVIPLHRELRVVTPPPARLAPRVTAPEQIDESCVERDQRAS